MSVKTQNDNRVHFRAHPTPKSAKLANPYKRRRTRLSKVATRYQMRKRKGYLVMVYNG